MNEHSFFQRLNAFFFEPMDARPLAWFRMAIALFALLQVAILSTDWLNIYGVSGYVEWFISYELFSIKHLPSVVNLANWLIGWGMADNTVVLGVSGMYVLALVGLLLGFYTRLSAVIAWLMHFMLCNTAMSMGYGVETFLHIALFYLMFAPSAAYYSLDARAGRAAPVESWQARFCLRLMQLHLCLVYFHAGIAKWQGADWQSGEAIWYVLGNQNYSQFDMSFLASYPFISRLLSWWTLVIETAYPLFMPMRRTRLFWLFNVVMLHAGIAVFMGLYMFGLIMILHNLAIFGGELLQQKAPQRATADLLPHIQS